MILPNSKSLHQSKKFRISLTCVCRLYLLLVQLTKQIHWESVENRFEVLYCPHNGHTGLSIRMMDGIYLRSSMPIAHRTQKLLNDSLKFRMRKNFTTRDFSGKSRTEFEWCVPISFSRTRVDIEGTVISGLRIHTLKKSDLKRMAFEHGFYGLGVSYSPVFISDEKHDVNTPLKRLPSEEKRSNTRASAFCNMVDLRISS